MQEMTSRNYVDISFTVKDSVRQGRKLLRDLDTGQMFYDPPEPVVDETVPEGYFDGPPNPPLGYNVEPVVEPEPFPVEPVVEELVNPAPKSRKKRLLHG
jgi:hypothetical protein